MNLRLLHRRLAVLMAGAGLVAFAGGAGFEPIATALTALALSTALFWRPEPAVSRRLERLWLPVAALLVARALYHVFVVHDDVVIPVVDLLLLLMSAEALRSLDAPNDVRLYALSFALVLASTAYRPGIVFLLAFVAFVALGTVALMVGHLRRSAERHRVREMPLGSGMIGATAALSLVTLSVAAVVFLTFPRISRGWTGRGGDSSTAVAGFSNTVSLAEYGSRIYGNPQIVLRVEFPDGRPAPARLSTLHWRGRSYDHFDGVRWSRSRGLPPSKAPTRWYESRWRGPTLAQRIYAIPLDMRVLFTLHPVVGIDPESSIHPLLDNAGDFAYWGSGAPAYTAYSKEDPPAPEDLRRDRMPERFTPAGRYYLQLPELDPRIPALADSLTRGLYTRYDEVMAIQGWLRSLRYTLELPATPADATLANFLFARRAGHCEYFSTAMVVLLRTLGIEARNVNGFLGGEWSQFGDYLAVTQNQAHSWVEVWFPGYGWVTFDPTPGGGDTGVRAQAWFWPGRFFFDAVQHRWSKWVLDYDAESQAGLFRRWSDALESGRPQPTPRAVGSEGSGSGPSTWLAALALLVVALGLVRVWRTREGTGLPPSTRMYVTLRRHCRRAGLGLAPGVTPLALVERVRAWRAAAGRPAERVVDLYLRARYGHEPLRASELREMREALNAARRILRTRA